MTGLLNPKSSEIRIFFFGMILLVVYLGHGVFRPVWQLQFCLNQFWG